MPAPYIHSTAIIDTGALIGEDTKVWHHTHVMPGAQIGRQCILGQNVFIGEGVKIGNRVKIQNNVSLYTGVTCEDFVFLGPSCVFTNVINPRSAIERKDQFRPTLVKEGATVGANATIVCGNNIGRYALIGAGAVITKDVPDYTLWAGNPAIQTGWVSEYGHRLDFDETGYAFCPESGQKYRLQNGTVTRIKE